MTDYYLFSCRIELDRKNFRFKPDVFCGIVVDGDVNEPPIRIRKIIDLENFLNNGEGLSSEELSISHYNCVKIEEYSSYGDLVTFLVSKSR